MTKIISGNEIPTQRERLNPKIFARERRLQFSGADLEDNESRSAISLADFKKKIKYSFTYSAKLKRFEEITANCSKHNLLVNKQNAFISYFREGIDRRTAINNILRFMIDDVRMEDDENHIHFNVKIQISPFKEIIEEKSENEEIKALSTKLFNFYGKEQSVIKITDNEIRREEIYNVGQFTITRDEIEKNIYKGSKSLIISTENQKFKYNLSFSFTYDEERYKMSMSIDNYELVGLYFSDKKDNIFVAQRPIVSNDSHEIVTIDVEKTFVDGEIINPTIDCAGYKSMKYVNLLADPYSQYFNEKYVNGIEKIIFWDMDGYSHIKELTKQERFGLEEIEIPNGCDHIEYIYNDDTVSYDDKKIYYQYISFLMYHKDSNYEFDFYCLAKDCKVYNLCDSFEHFDSFDSKTVSVRNISNIETDVEILSYDYDFNMDYSSTQENYIK